MRAVKILVFAAVIAVLHGPAGADAALAQPGAAQPVRQRPSVAAADVPKRWRKLAPAAADDALGATHAYLDLRRSPAAQAKAAACGAQPTLEARAACKRAALAPTPAEERLLRAHFAPMGPAISEADFLGGAARGCHFGFSAVNCRGATVAAARQVFGAGLRFARYVQAGRADQAEAKQAAALRLRPAVLTEDDVSLPAALAPLVTAVSGVQVYDHRLHGAKHLGKTLAPQHQKKDANAVNAADPYGQPWMSFTPQAWNGLAVPSGRAAPIVHVDVNYAYVVPMCADGTPAQLSAFAPAGTPPACASQAPLPAVVVNAFLADAPAAVVHAEPVQMATQCASAGDFSAWAGFAVCRAALQNAFNQSTTTKVFQYFGFSAVSTFADGTTATGAPLNFFDGTNYAAGAVDMDNQTLAANPPVPGFTLPQTVLTPADMYARYNVPAGASAAGQVQGVVEFSDPQQPAGGFFSSDLELYLSELAKQNGAAALANMSVVGNSSIVSRGETTLDIELIMGLAPQAASYILCLSYGPGAEYASYPDALVGFATRATASVGAFGMSAVWSISYGGPEWTSAPQLMQHIDSLLEQLSASGVTVSASSGDSGTYFYEGAPTAAPEVVVFSANWPATSPHVVAVGATAARTSAAQPAPFEVASNVRDFNIITSGGGFSQVFPTPAFQASAVQGAGGNGMRGIPDVAMAGAWIGTVLQGQLTPLFGTSASSPIFAAMVTLMNARRAAAGQPPLTAVPQLVYAAGGAAFNDVVVGDNCAGEPVQPGLSMNFPSYAQTQCYFTRAGWDAVTGLGSVNFGALYQTAQSWSG